MLAAAALYVYVLETGFDAPAPLPVSAPIAASIAASIAAPISAPTAAPTAVASRAAPIAAASLLRNASADWRYGKLESNPQVFAIAYPKLREQAMAMNRMAAYLEKASAPRDRLLGDAELAAVIARAGDQPETFYLGHDYRMDDVARFFNQARQQHLVLQAQEQRLLDLLLAQGLIAIDAGAAKPYQTAAKGSALITLSAFTPADRSLLNLAPDDQVLGSAVLAHEVSHGEFLTRPSYRQQSWYFWQSVLNEPERQKWRLLLRRMDYDAANEDLLVNEMQALLMHTPDARIFSTVHLLIPEPELVRQRRLFGAAAKAAAP
jgi:hypothetical protein